MLIIMQNREDTIVIILSETPVVHVLSKDTIS